MATTTPRSRRNGGAESNGEETQPQRDERLREEPAVRDAARAEGAVWIEVAPLGGAAEMHVRRINPAMSARAKSPAARARRALVLVSACGPLRARADTI